MPQAADRKVELVLACELQKDEVGRKPAHVQAGESVVACDPVVDVHHQVAFLEVAEVRTLGAKRPRLARRAAYLGAGTEDVLVRVEGEPFVGIDEAGADLADHQVGVDVRREGRLLQRHDLRHEIAVEEKPSRPLRLRRRVAGNDGRRPPFAERLQPAHQRRQRPVLAMMALDLGAQLAGGLQLEVDLGSSHRGVRADGEARQLEQRRRLHGRAQIALVHEVLVRGQRELAFPAGSGEGVLQCSPEISPLALELQRIVQDPDRVFGQVLGERREAPRVEPRKDRRQTCGKELVVLREIGEIVDELAKLPGGSLDRVGGCAHSGDGGATPFLVQHDLARRAERDLLQVAGGALRLRIERADLLHQVAEELEPSRLGVQGRPDVEHAAADGEGAGIVHQRDAGVAGRGELAGQLVAVVLHLQRDLQAPPIQGGAGKHTAPDGLDRADHDRLLAEVQAEEGRETLLRDEPVRGEPFVRQHFVARDAHHGAVAGEEPQVALQRLRRLLVGLHADERPLRVLRQPDQRVSAGGAEKAARLDLARAFAEGGEELGERSRAPFGARGEVRGCGRSRFQSTRPPPREGAGRSARFKRTGASDQPPSTLSAPRFYFLKWSNPERRGSGRGEPSSVSWMPRPRTMRPTSTSLNFFRRAGSFRFGTVRSSA